jgi:protein-disulfide isomerase
MEPGPLKEMTLGDENAPVTIVEYMSMTCPHCASFHTENFKPLVEKYVDTGKVRFVLREFPFDPRAAAAIMLARCAPENQFFPMVDVLFKQQRNWATASDGRASTAANRPFGGFYTGVLRGLLDEPETSGRCECCKNQGCKRIWGAVDANVFINGKRYPGNMSVETMSAIIDPLL